MATKVGFKNPRSGETRNVKVGWSWILFFFAGFLGIPLFLRKLHIWGGVFLAIWLVNLLLSASDPLAFTAMRLGLVALGVGMSIWMAIKGNELTAKNYLELGWEMVDPEGDAAKAGKDRWGLG